MMIRKRLLFSLGAVIAICCGCGEEEKKEMFGFTIERASGQSLPLSMENIAGRWAVNKMYNDYSDLTAFNPTLQTGFLELREDLTFSYCQNYKMNPTVYSGRIDTDSLEMGILNLVDIPDPNNEGFNRPNIRLIVSAVTKDQLELEWEHFDPEVGSSGGGSNLLFEFEFKFQPEDNPLIYPVSRDQLKPTIYNDKISVTNFEAMYPYQSSIEGNRNTKMLWQYAFSTQEEGGDGVVPNNGHYLYIKGDSVILGAFNSNLDNSSAQVSNAHFYVSSDEMVVIDSLGFTGRRRHTNATHASRVMFYWSRSTINNFSSATAYHEFTKTNSQFSNLETALMPTLSTPKGKGFWLGICANIASGGLGTLVKNWNHVDASYLILHNVKVYGRIYEGERFHYYYLMNKMQ